MKYFIITLNCFILKPINKTMFGWDRGNINLTAEYKLNISKNVVFIFN